MAGQPFRRPCKLRRADSDGGLEERSSGPFGPGPMPFKVMTADLACEMLSKVGVHLVPAEVRVDERDERWVVRLPNARLAWFAASEEGALRLKTERRVL